MNKRSAPTQTIDDLRQRAERKLAAEQKDPAGQPADAHKLLHELQVHQIELEMQNEALREARDTAEMALERAAELFDFAPVAYFVLGRILQTNFHGELLLGVERLKIAGKPLSNSLSGECRPAFRKFLEQVFSSADTQRCEMTLRVGGKTLWVAIEAIAEKTRKTCLAALLDITARKHSEQALQLAATVYMALEEAIMVVDDGNQIVSVNPAFTRLTGYAPEEVIGQPSALFSSGHQDEAFYQALWNSLDATGHWQGERWNRRKNGSAYLESLSISTVYGDSGEVIRRVAMAFDLTEKKQAEEAILKHANIDSLTGLPNRRLFLDRLQQAVHKAHRANHKLALMFLDLDHFKDVNDTLGHDVGDSLLKETAQRLKTCIRETDTLARPGGDEFTIVVGELDELASLDRVAQCILQSMTAPFQLGNERCYASFSIGIALYPDDAVDLEDLLKKADQAMYSAKHQGRNRFCYFTPAMQEAADNRLRMANDLRGALADGQLWVAYQPIVKLATGEIQKAEALLRWRHPVRGLVSPAEFIPIAEETGMIIELGEWIFHQAASQVESWRAHYYPGFQIGVNKSPVQFHHQGNDHGNWFEHLQRLGLPGACIVVEITERLLLDASPGVEEKLLAFRDADMQVSLDDFGTGYSSLSYLKKFQIDYLKIDQDFVRNLTDNSTDLALCEAIILMAHKLGMQVVAEGIETAAQRDLLLRAGCDYGQGYLFSGPLPADEFERLLAGGEAGQAT
jgi:diguanylate cyclase (GGDEF)-like protein/PAS domain S-box-containing protein